MRLYVTIFLIFFSFSVNSQTAIFFSKSKGALNSGGTLDVMMYNPNTKTTSLLLKGTIRGRGEYNFVTSPDGYKAIFNTYQFSGWKLAVGDINEGEISNVKKFTDRKNYEYCGKYSPDGLSVVYQEFDWNDRSSNLMIANKDGSNAKLLFKNNVSDQSLDWTKDNNSIVFTQLNNNSLSIYMISIRDKSLKRLSNSEANDFAPSTSKTEDKVAFLSDRNGKIDLFIMDTDGGNLKNLTSKLKTADADASNIWAYKVSWSPDGEKLVFNAMINNSLELFIVNSDGSNLYQITDNKDSNITPFWSN